MNAPLKIPALDFDISIGARVEYTGQTWEVTFIDRQRETICFRKVNGDTTFHFSFGRFSKKLKHKSLVIIRKTPPLTVMALTAATLDRDDRIAFERRCAYVKLANQFELGAPRKDFLKATLQLWSERNESAARENRPLEKEAPSYSRIKKWQQLVLQSGTLLPLAYSDHRKKPRATRLDPAIEKLIQDYAEAIYLKNIKTSALDVHDAVCLAVDKLNSEAPAGSHPLRKPCPDTIYRRLEALDPIVVDLERKGKEFVRKNYNYGAAQYIPPFIGGMVQCDCHQLDLLIYDDVLGISYRPWLMVFFDCHTRCVVGWELSELAPSAEKAMRCFKNTIAESADHRYRCIPHRVIFDNGVEFINESIKTTATMLFCTIEYGQVRTPNSKSIVERFFRTLAAVIHKLSGTTFSNIFERADYDSDGNAIYTLTEIRQIFRDFLNFYHLRRHWQLGLSPDSQWRLACDKQEPRIIDAESAATLGTSVRHCSIRSGTIGFSGISWHAPSLPQLQAALETSGEKAQLHYDESDLGYAWVRHPRMPNEVIRCDPVSPHYQIGLTLKLHQSIRQTKKDYEADTGNTEKARVLRAAFTTNILYDLATSKTRKSNRARAREIAQLKSSAESMGLDITTLFDPASYVTDNPPQAPSSISDEANNSHDKADYLMI